jgi:hypothetical protein
LDRPVGPDGCPLTGQLVLVEPVTHGGRVDAQLAGDASGWPSPGHCPMGQVVPQRREAQLCHSSGEPLVGAAALPAGGGHLAGRRGEAGGGQQAANHRGGGAKLLG